MVEEQQKKTCSSHQHSFRFYCLTCEQNLCSDCFAFFHDRTHPIILLSDLNNPELKKIYSKFKEVESMLTNFDELYGDTKKNKLQLLQEMKENNIKYLDTIKHNMSMKYDEIINKIKESKQTQIPIVNQLKEKQNILKQMLRSLKTLQSNQGNITSLFQEIDSLGQKYSEELDTTCNSVSMISFKDWASYQEMSFKFDNYKENVNSKNHYHIGFCNWNLSIQKDKENLGAVIILNNDCLQNIDEEINFTMDVELMNQKHEKSIVLKEHCRFTKTNNKKVINKLCSVNDLEEKGFANENGYVEIKVRVKFQDINDFLTMQQFGLVKPKV